MVIELKPKYYTCLDLSAPVDLASCPSTYLDHWSTLDHHELLTEVLLIVYSRSSIINTQAIEAIHTQSKKAIIRIVLQQYKNSNKSL